MIAAETKKKEKKKWVPCNLNIYLFKYEFAKKMKLNRLPATLHFSKDLNIRI